jgi:hypothetical protein
MARKKSGVERALRRAQTVLASYIKPGRKSAEATIDELLRVLGKARGVLRAVPGRSKRRGTRGRRAAGRAAAARRSTGGAIRRKAAARRRKARAAR